MNPHRRKKDMLGHPVRDEGRANTAVLLVAVLAVLVVTLGGSLYTLKRDRAPERVRMPAPSGADAESAVAGARHAGTVVVPASDKVDGFTYRIPGAGDPDFADYQEMLRHPAYERFNRSDAPLYYDPEWRSEATGRREVPQNDLRLSNGATTPGELARFVLIALAENDSQAIDMLRVSRDEFQLLCWPEFPRSRPFLRIPADEAWAFQVAQMKKGAQKALTAYGKRNLELLSLSTGSVREYTNFKLHEGVEIQVRDVETGEEIRVAFVASLIECRGVFKVFTYED